MRKATNSYLIILSIIICISLVGCGGSGGGSGSGSGTNNSSHSNYYESANSNIINLTKPFTPYSTYNGQTSIEVKNIPVDPSKEVLYACLITNPNNSDIINLTLTPPLTYNMRASEDEDSSISNADISSNDLSNIRFRENVVEKARLKEELYKKYLENEANNKKFSLRASIDHQNESLNQKDIIIKIFGRERKCTLAMISKYSKIFIDQDSDKEVSAPNIHESNLIQLANEFDNYIYPILRDCFGNNTDNFWNDVDNDGKLSIVFSPVCNNYASNIAGIFDTSSINDWKYARDIICISVKEDNDTPYEQWFSDARETIIHEMQHIVNYSAKKRIGSSNETLWIDEGLAVCAEILYRQRRRLDGLTSYSNYFEKEITDFEGNDARFYYASYVLPELSLRYFNNTGDITEALAHYGQKGLFFYFIYEQYGSEVLRKLCQGPYGNSKFSELDRDLGQLSTDFNYACLLEKLRNLESLSGFSTNPYDLADKSHKFKTNMKLNYILSGGYFRETTSYDIERSFTNLSSTRKMTLSTRNQTIPSDGGTIRIILKQPKNFSNIINTNNYTLTFTSSRPVVINMMRFSD